MLPSYFFYLHLLNKCLPNKKISISIQETLKNMVHYTDGICLSWILNISIQNIIYICLIMCVYICMCVRSNTYTYYTFFPNLASR